MSELVPEQIAVKDLPGLLGVPRSRVYTLMDALSINPKKIGRSAYIQQTEFLRLEEVQRFVRSGGTVPEWLSANPTEAQEISYDMSLVNSLDTVGQLPENNIELVIGTLERILPRLLPSTRRSIKEKLETLNFAAQEGITLSNLELASLLELTPKTLTRKKEIRSNGFTFKKSKEGSSVYWQVQKSI